MYAGYTGANYGGASAAGGAYGAAAGYGGTSAYGYGYGGGGYGGSTGTGAYGYGGGAGAGAYGYGGGYGGERRSEELGAKLQRIEWSRMELVPFEKNFYVEHPDIAAMPNDEADRIRAQHEITILAGKEKSASPERHSPAAPLPQGARARSQEGFLLQEQTYPNPCPPSNTPPFPSTCWTSSTKPAFRSRRPFRCGDTAGATPHLRWRLRRDDFREVSCLCCWGR